MKVVLSIDPIRFPLTGIGRYTLELATHLQQRPEIEELRFFSGLTYAPGLPAEGQADRPGLAARLRPVKRLLANSNLVLDLHGALSHWRRGRALRNAGDAVFHGPNFYLPPFPGRSVATIHDLSVFKMPEVHPRERVRFMQREIALTLKRASALITVSHYTRQEVAEYFSWPIEKIIAAPLASGPEFRPYTADETRPALQSLGLERNGYALYLGTIEPRKNIAALLDAYSLLPEATKRHYPLVIAGHRGWNNEAIFEKIRRAESEGWARYLGFVDKADLPKLLAGARAFLFPTLYEGFGLPVLEAMACGTPVVTSRSTSLPEVVGNAALLCQPADVEGISATIEKAMTDEAWRLQASMDGLYQSRKFSWERNAIATVEAYQQALSS